MKKKIVKSLLVCGLLSSANATAAEDLSTMFSEGKVSGQIREFSLSREYVYTDSSKDYTRTGNAIGGHLKFETAEYNGLSFGTALYTTNAFLNDGDRSDLKQIDPTLYGPNNSDYSLLGEAYVQYKRGKTTFKGGRQKLQTPLAGGDDARMMGNLFEGYIVSNTDLADTTLIAGHITRFAQGTFGRVYNAGILSATSGYSLTDSRNNVGQFVNMGEYAIGKKTSGVSVASATYTGVKNLKLQLWDYYAHDILNAIYAQADYKLDGMFGDDLKPFVAAQVIVENGIGDKLAGEIDSSYIGAKIGAKVENFTGYVAYSQSSSNSATDAASANAIITPWGGMPAFTQGMVTRHMFLAGTKATKLALVYNWKAFGPNLKTVAYFTNFQMAANNGYTQGDASENGFDMIYYPAAVKNLQLRLRGNFPDAFNDDGAGNTVGWNEYRFIVNYNF